MARVEVKIYRNVKEDGRESLMECSETDLGTVDVNILVGRLVTKDIATDAASRVATELNAESGNIE